MRVANLSHGAYFMLGAYVGLSVLNAGYGFWPAVAAGALTIAVLGGVIERVLLRRLAGRTFSQELVTLGIAFMIADSSLLVWSGDPMPLPVPRGVMGAALAGMGGVLGGPILSVYPGLDMDMLPLALIVLILGGPGSLPGAFAGSFFIGFLYTFGQALFPQLAYVILFLPMVAALVLRPKGLFGARAA